MGSCHSSPVRYSGSGTPPAPALPRRYRRLIYPTSSPVPRTHSTSPSPPTADPGTQPTPLHPIMPLHLCPLRVAMEMIISREGNPSTSFVVQPGPASHPPTIHALCKALEGRNPYVLVGTGLPRDTLDIDVSKLGWKALERGMSGKAGGGVGEGVEVVLVGAAIEHDRPSVKRDRGKTVCAKIIGKVLVGDLRDSADRDTESLSDVSDSGRLSAQSSTPSLTLVNDEPAPGPSLKYTMSSTSVSARRPLQVIVISLPTPPSSFASLCDLEQYEHQERMPTDLSGVVDHSCA